MVELASYAVQREREQGLRGIRLLLKVGDPGLRSGADTV
jgi:hypothetical protein